MGENWESGGKLRSSVHRWMTFTDATVTCDGTPVVENGNLVFP
jgi:hypothetical protein